jgi:hypothetical protein
MARTPTESATGAEYTTKLECCVKKSMRTGTRDFSNLFVIYERARANFSGTPVLRPRWAATLSPRKIM